MGVNNLSAIKEEDGEHGSMNFSIMENGINNQLTQEGDAEGQSQIDLAEAFNELERNDIERGEINFENQEDDDEINLVPYASILDKLSLIDK